MTAEIAFSLSNNIALLSWLFLVSGGRWMPRAFNAIRIAMPLTLAATYTACLAMAAPDIEGGFGSIQEVRALFGNDWALTAGWVHYLAFDFFVGCWILERSKTQVITHWLVVPCLIATFMLGPFGYMLFHALQLGNRRFATTS